MIVNRWERTVEHRNSTAEIERHFGDGVVWQPYLPKRTVLQDAVRQGVPSHRLVGKTAREVADAFAHLARRIETLHAGR